MNIRHPHDILKLRMADIWRFVEWREFDPIRTSVLIGQRASGSAVDICLSLQRRSVRQLDSLLRREYRIPTEPLLRPSSDPAAFGKNAEAPYLVRSVSGASRVFHQTRRLQTEGCSHPDLDLKRRCRTRFPSRLLRCSTLGAANHPGFTSQRCVTPNPMIPPIRTPASMQSVRFWRADSNFASVFPSRNTCGYADTAPDLVHFRSNFQLLSPTEICTT